MDEISLSDKSIFEKIQILKFKISIIIIIIWDTSTTANFERRLRGRHTET